MLGNIMYQNVNSLIGNGQEMSHAYSTKSINKKALLNVELSLLDKYKSNSHLKYM